MKTLDFIIRVYGDAAIASFYWYRNWILTPDQEGPNPSAVLIQSLFLVKQDGSWKIAYSHISPLDPGPPCRSPKSRVWSFRGGQEPGRFELIDIDYLAEVE